jgi:phenylpyruvate tautomerase PptA (4-oxalocrotonate tautomerase family)
MPIVEVELERGWSGSEKKAILDAVHDSLVDAFKILDDDRVQKVVEYETENFDVPSSGFVIVTITAFEGRSLDAKRNLYRLIVERLSDLGFAPTHVKVVLTELPLDNWGIRGGKPASEVNLGFDVNV